MLSASQRLNLLKDITNRLGPEDWPLIDITLDQFKLPTSDRWEGDKSAYVLHMVKAAPDATLLELAQHVGAKTPDTARTGVDPPFWQKRMFRLFISHLSSEKIYAAELQGALLKYGVSGFVAHNDIEPTLEWQTQIESALATADSLIALLHPKFHASNWTDQEIGFAMGRGLPVYAVRFGQDPYGFIGRFQAFSGGDKSAETLALEIFETYRKNKQSRERMAESLVSLFEDAGSFVQAKSRIGYLEDMESWRDEFISRVESAGESNSQISGSFGVPARVTRLLRKWRAGAA